MVTGIDKYYFCNISVKSIAINYTGRHCIDIPAIYNYNQNYIDYMMDGVILPILGFIGIVGNVCGIITFRRNRLQIKKSRTYYSLMLSLCVSDLVTILALIGLHSLPFAYIHHYVIVDSVIVAYVEYSAFYIYNVTHFIGIYLMISLCIERYYSICKPLSSIARKCSWYRYVIPILFFCIVLHVPHFISTKLVSTEKRKWIGNNTSIKFIRNVITYAVEPTHFYGIWFDYYDIGADLLVRHIFPYFCLIFLNTMIVRAIRGNRYTVIKEENIGKDKCPGKWRKVKLSNNVGKIPCLYVHISEKEICARKMQVNLAIINLAIAAVFVVSRLLGPVMLVMMIVKSLSNDVPILHFLKEVR